MGSAPSLGFESGDEDLDRQSQLSMMSRLHAQNNFDGQVDTPAAGMLGARPTQAPTLKNVPIYKNPLHVRPKTVRLIPTTTPASSSLVCDDRNELDSQGEMQLAFTLDSTMPVEVTVYVGSWDACPGRPPESTHRWTSSPHVFPDPGLNQGCYVALDSGSLAARQAGLLDFTFPSQEVTCFCIEIVGLAGMHAAAAQDEVAANGTRATIIDGPVEWTKGRFIIRKDESVCNASSDEFTGYVAEVQSQSINQPGNQCPLYEREVFGADTQDPAVMGHDCVICMSEPRDTAVLPCRHMCLCGGCADTMRARVQYRSYRCPMCRERVSSFLRLQRPASETTGT